MQRGHKGCTSAGTDARTEGTVKVRIGHVIDRGRRKGTVHMASCPSLGIRRWFNSRPLQEAKEGGHGIKGGGKRGDRVKRK